MKPDLMKNSQIYSDHISGLCDSAVSVMDTDNKIFIYHSNQPKYICSKCSNDRCNVINTHLYGSQEARRWRGHYIYYCPLGLVFISSILSDEKYNAYGSIITGPIIMGNLEDTINELPDSDLKNSIGLLPVFTPSKINQLAAVMEAVTTYISGSPHVLSNSSYQPSEIGIDNENSLTFMIEYEKRLQCAISENNISEARELLNEIVGNIFFSGNFDLSSIKTRCVELIVLISRSTIDAGADVSLVLDSNTNYIQQMEQFTSIEELSVWLTGILHRFINISFDLLQARHSDIIYKTMEYIKSNYTQKLTLDEISNHIYLSRSYLSSVFKKETGGNLTTYINHIRIEKSKKLLLDRSVSLADIAGLCGFDDQSYFSKVFKKDVGVSPKKYRDSRGQIS